ncbi:MAG: UDP-3-O-(3-hydroxymyristoyl)glucosamine N-acyltransferase [Alphaproteobacteria bacterium]
MPDSRFFDLPGPVTAGALEQVTGATLHEAGLAGRMITGIAPLESAGPDHLSFFDNRAYLAAFENSAAGACFVRPAFVSRAPAGMACLITDDPYRAYALAASHLYPEPEPEPGRHGSAIIDPSARLGDGCQVDAGAVIGAHVEIGARSWIGANAVIGAGVQCGAALRLGANCTISHSVIGERVAILPGARIGQRGFGFAMSPQGHQRVPQLGRVIIEDDVEIGANVTIDRGAGPDTVIGAGSVIDNLVQIGHNVRLGRGCVIVAQAGISGSTRLGNFVVMAGQAGLAGHLSVGDGAQVGAKAGAMRDIAAGERVLGSPAVPARQFFRQISALERLAGSRPGVARTGAVGTSMKQKAQDEADD